MATLTQSLPKLSTLFCVILILLEHLYPPFSLTQHASGFTYTHSHLPQHDPWEANSCGPPPGTTACALSNMINMAVSRYTVICPASQEEWT